MTTRDTSLEGLYQARDELDAALNKIKSLNPADVTQALSSYYRVGLTLLQDTCALLEELGAQAERARSQNPHVHAAIAEIHALHNELTECSAHAEQGQNTVTELHRDEAPRFLATTKTRGTPWAVTRRR